MANTHNTLTDLFTNIANAIRTKTGKTGSIKADDFPSEISGISVGVEGGIIPTGTKIITTNGTHDVTNFASANVNVPQNEIMGVVRDITLAEQMPNGAFTTILTGDEFVKKHYADDYFSIRLMYVTVPEKTNNYVYGIYNGNMNMGTSSAGRYGFAYVVNASGSLTFLASSNKVNAGNWQANLRVYDTGDVAVYIVAPYILPAGQYKLIMNCAGH